MLIDWSDEFNTWLDRLEDHAHNDPISARRLDYITAQLQHLQELTDAPEEDTAHLRRVRQSKTYPVWRLAPPTTPTSPCGSSWFPDDEHAVIALFAGDKARIGNAFYNSVEPEPTPPSETWKRRKDHPIMTVEDRGGPASEAARRPRPRRAPSPHPPADARGRPRLRHEPGTDPPRRRPHQVELARRLGVGQAAVSRSTRPTRPAAVHLSSYVAAAGANAHRRHRRRPRPGIRPRHPGRRSATGTVTSRIRGTRQRAAGVVPSFIIEPRRCGPEAPAHLERPPDARLRRAGWVATHL